MWGGGYFINIHHYHVLINYFIIIEVIMSRQTQLQHLIWMRLCVMVQMKKRMTVTLHMLNLLT